MEMLVFSWFGLSVAAGIWAGERGWNGMVYFLLGLFLTPFLAFAIVSMNGVNQARLDELAIKSGRMKQCFMCAELARSAAHRCPHCGADLDPTPTP